MSILLPTTFGVSPVSAIIMLAGIYYGAMYGGSTTSILVNIPGESASVVTCLDGYQMARNGRAGPALGISAFGSFIGGTFSLLVLMFIAGPLAKIALKFGPPEYFSLMCLCMTILIYVAKGSVVKAVIMGLFGFMLSTVGLDLTTGKPRFAFGSPTLYDGIGMVPLAMGLFGISEVLTNIEGPLERTIFKSEIKHLLPNLNDWKRSAGPISRGTVIGFLLGILPGAGSIASTFVSYTVEKKISKHPEEFGKGAIEGVAAPETANNAASRRSLCSSHDSGNSSQCGHGRSARSVDHSWRRPRSQSDQRPPSEIFWGTIASMYLGNVMLLLLNLPLIGMWVQSPQGPLRHPDALDPALLPDRHLQHQQQYL